jgi:hypothetical protein
MKRVLITAGQVYGRLDDNKLVGNRVRGIWALRFAKTLVDRGHLPTILIPDTMSPQFMEGLLGPRELPIKLLRHGGLDSYQRLCELHAPLHDAAVMAAAVVNWIPAEPISGKMETKGYQVGDRIDIPFYLAPRVIESMKAHNPKLTLIGCKMLIGSEYGELIEAAYGVLLKSKCNAVIANDQKLLKTKRVVYQDRTVQSFDFRRGGGDAFEQTLIDIIEDEHYCTKEVDSDIVVSDFSRGTFDVIVDKYRERFTPRQAEGSDKVFGAVLVRLANGYLASPREKGELFTSYESALVESVKDRTVHVASHIGSPVKATLNAPLLARVADKYNVATVLHLHEQLPGVPTVPYAPPGTVRDNERDIPAPVFNIEGHGFIACLDEDEEILDV